MLTFNTCLQAFLLKLIITVTLFQLKKAISHKANLTDIDKYIYLICLLIYFLMIAEQPLFLKNFWYVAFYGNDLKKGKLLAKEMLGEKLVFGRDNNGNPFALKDNCPHQRRTLILWMV